MVRKMILEHTLGVDGVGQFPAKAWIDMAERGDRLAVTFHIIDPERQFSREQTLAKFKIRFKAYNPIDAGFVTYYASKYGVCVAWKMSRFTIKKGMADYEAYKRLFPDASVKDSIGDIWSKFAHDSDLFKNELQKVLGSCLVPRRLRFGGDEGPDDGPFIDF